MKSPNPGGRTRGINALLDEVVDWRVLAERLYDIALSQKTGKGASTRDRLRAIEMLTDRRFGKPQQKIDVTGDSAPDMRQLEDADDADLERMIAAVDRAALEAGLKPEEGEPVDAEVVP